MQKSFGEFSEEIKNGEGGGGQEWDKKRKRGGEDLTQKKRNFPNFNPKMSPEEFSQGFSFSLWMQPTMHGNMWVF